MDNDSKQLKSENRLLKSMIHDAIQYSKEKELEYLEDFKKDTGGNKNYWKGKAHAHQFNYIRLQKILDYCE